MRTDLSLRGRSHKAFLTRGVKLSYVDRIEPRYNLKIFYNVTILVSGLVPVNMENATGKNKGMI